MRLVNKQFLVFAMTGVINTTVDVAAYTFLNICGAPIMAAIFVSTSLGLLCSFMLNRSLAFRGTVMSKDIAYRFVAVTLTGLWVLQPLVILSLQKLIEPTNEGVVTMKLLATAASLVWNYTLYKKYVFITSSR